MTMDGGNAATSMRRWAGIVAIAGLGAGALTRLASALLVARGGGDLQPVFLCTSVVVLGAMVALVRADKSVWTRGLTEAATLTTGAFGLLMWVGVARPYVANAALGDGARRMAELALVVDLAIAIALVCLVSRRPARSRTTVALLVGGACHVITDVAVVVVSAQHGSQVTVGRLAAVLAAYGAVGVVVYRTGDGAPAPQAANGPAVFDPLVGVVLINSVTVVLAGVHEDRVGSLMVAAAALVLTAVAARAQWRLHASDEAMLRSVQTERNWLRDEHVALEATHAVASGSLSSTAEFLEEMTTRIAGPLNGVLEAADRLDDAELTHSSGVLLGVMNELLGVSQDVTATPEFSDDDFSLRTVLGSTLDPYVDAASCKVIAFGVHVDDNVPEMVRGDAARLRELIGVFAENAVRYTEHGRIDVTVSFVEVRNGDEYVVYFEVTDTGTGLSDYDCYRAFEFDVRAEPHKRRYRGKARGLNRARLLVEGFDGLYGVESELGRGATFWFTVALRAANHVTDRAADPLPAPSPDPEVEAAPVPLMEPAPAPIMYEPEPDVVEFAESELDVPEPVSHAPEPEAVSEPEPEPQPEPEPVHVSDAAPIIDEPLPRSGMILFAEDDPLCRRITVAALRRAGYHVDTVTNGADAVHAVAERRYDLVLMDIQLPVMTGLEAAAAIRNGTRNNDVPIIAVSAFTTEKEQVAALEAGMDAFVKKPLDIDPLLSALDRWMRQHALT